MAASFVVNNEVIMSSIIKFDQFNITTPVHQEEGEFWLTQSQLACLFGVSQQAISKNIEELIADGDLENSVHNLKLYTASDGKKYQTKMYGNDVVYALGYKTRNSKLAREFRAATTEVLKTLARDGVVMDKQVLTKKKDSIEIAMQELKAIRADERSAMEKLNNFFSSSVLDLEEKSTSPRCFYSYVQNKLHYATHKHTAADLIVIRADHTKENMGVVHFKGSEPTKHEVGVAKNYLTEEELLVMNRLVNIVLDSALDFLSRKMKNPASFWYEFVDKLLDTLGRPILKGSGQYTSEEAKACAISERAKYRVLKSSQQEFDKIEG